MPSRRMVMEVPDGGELPLGWRVFRLLGIREAPIGTGTAIARVHLLELMEEPDADPPGEAKPWTPMKPCDPTRM